MTKGDVDGKIIWGRPIKPVAGFMSLLMMTLVVYNVLDRGVFGNLWLGDIIAVMAAVSAFCLWYGWVGRAQKMAEAGLLIACIVYIIRAAFVFFLLGPSSEIFWLSLWAGGLVGGAFYLEARDGVATRRST